MMEVEKSMFNMKELGRKIALLRKNKNLTQMGLADLLGISFQAVSNWERGETMPDIAKLPELAQILEVSIDEILNNEAGTKIIKNVIEGKSKDYVNGQEVSSEEFANAAPLLKPEQINEVAKGISKVDNVGEMIQWLPFVSKETADKVAEKALEYEDIILEDLLPFISKGYADKIVMKAMEKNHDIEELIEVAPFVSKGAADSIAEKAISNGVYNLMRLLPFVSGYYADIIVEKEIDRSTSLEAIIKEAIPFISTPIVDRLAQMALDKNLDNLQEKFFPFVSEKYSDIIMRRRYGL